MNGFTVCQEGELWLILTGWIIYLIFFYVLKNCKRGNLHFICTRLIPSPSSSSSFRFPSLGTDRVMYCESEVGGDVECPVVSFLKEESSFLPGVGG